LLCDLLLNVGGYIDFDDYGWRLRGSSLDPRRVPVTAELYTDAQIDDLQVKAIVDLLVRRGGTYKEIVKNRLFQKVAGTNASQAPISSTVSAVGGGQIASSPRPTLSVGAAHLFGGEFEVMMRVMRHGHRHYQEFGVGGSTLMAMHSGLESIVSVDSDADWVAAACRNAEIYAAISSGRADIRHADIGPVGQWGYPRDLGHIQSWPAYIATAWDVWSERNEMPDLIFVDGRFRVACCLSVILLAESGLHSTQELRVLLHDVSPERPFYDEVFEFFDVVESVNTLRVMKIKPDISGSRAMSVLLRHQFDPR
jgi:hypothetical protein